MADIINWDNKFGVIEGGKKIIDGVGQEAEVITNQFGGKQSKTPAALHLVDPEFFSKIFYGAEDKTSCDHIFETIIQSQRLNHTCEFEKLEEYSKICASLLTDFFKTKRK